jgi:dTDP-4-amino-4,6-dideoxygalactose transaminase
MTIIPVLDLKAQYNSLRGEIDDALSRVLERGIFILGEEVGAFEQEFATYCGAPYGIGVASGTDALHLAMLACGIGPGDEVITVSHTSVATVAAIQQAGAKPVLVDIHPAMFTIDPHEVETAITPRTRAILPVHLYGCPADMAPLLEIARRNELLVIEDCAQAHGAMVHDKRVGSWGDMAAFSFYPTKNLGAYGDGGMLVTANAELAERTRLLRQYGWRERYVSSLKGLNSRLDDLQAAVLRVKLKYLDQWNKRRQELAALYTSLLSNSPLVLPSQPEGVSHVYHRYVIRYTYRDGLKAYLDKHGVRTLVHYPVPVHLQPAYGDLGYSPGDLPATEAAASQVLSIPLYPEMSTDMVERVSQIALKYVKSGSD